jgi:hypothetical protein
LERSSSKLVELCKCTSFQVSSGERGLNRFEYMHGQPTDAENRPLSKGEKGILEATYILRCMLLVQRTYPRRRRDNIVYMFACNTPST